MDTPQNGTGNVTGALCWKTDGEGQLLRAERGGTGQEGRTGAAQLQSSRGKAECGMQSAALNAAESLTRVRTKQGMLDLVTGESGQCQRHRGNQIPAAARHQQMVEKCTCWALMVRHAKRSKGQ